VVELQRYVTKKPLFSLSFGLMLLAGITKVLVFKNLPGAKKIYRVARHVQERD